MTEQSSPILTFSRQKALAALLLAAATFIVFSRVLNNDFVGWDDDSYILNNPLIAPLSFAAVARMFSGFYFTSYTPLALLSHAIDYALWGIDPRGHHLTNLLVHVFNTWMVFLLALAAIRYARSWRGGGRGEGAPRERPGDGSRPVVDSTVDLAAALVSAVLFSWHPLRVESVACASSRKELLCAAFAFPSLLLYFRYRSGGGGAWRYAASVLLFAIALLAKSAVLAWPLCFVGCDVIEFRRRGEKVAWMRVAARAAPFFLLAAAAGYAAYAASASSRAPNLLGARPSLFLPGYALWFYIEKTVWPAGLSVVYTVPVGVPLVRGAALGLLALLAAALLLLRGKPACAVALGVFTLSLLPVLGIVPSTIQALAGRYAYVGSPALAILAGYAFRRAWSALRGDPVVVRALTGAVTTAVVAALVVLTEGGIATWRDAETMWRQAVRVSPDHPVVRLDLGLTLLDRGAYGESIEQISEAVKLKPDYAEGYSALGAALEGAGDTARAETAYRESLTLQPGNPIALERFGRMRIAQKRYADAARLLAAALNSAPGDPFATLCLADLCYKTGDMENALRFARSAIALRPAYGEAYYIAAAAVLSKSPADPVGIGYLKAAAALGFPPAVTQLQSQGLTP